MREKPHWPTNERHKLRKKQAKRKKKQRTSGQGPLTHNYFYSYSSPMIGRAIYDSNIILLKQADLRQKAILVEFPRSPRDDYGTYGAIYLNAASQKNITIDDFIIKRLSQCKQQAIEGKTSLLYIPKKTRSKLHDYELLRDVHLAVAKNMPELGGGGIIKNDDLEYYLMNMLPNLQGTVFRYEGEENPLQEAILHQGYGLLYEIEGISATRVHASLLHTKVRNFNPHKLYVYAINKNGEDMITPHQMISLKEKF